MVKIVSCDQTIYGLLKRNDLGKNHSVTSWNKIRLRGCVSLKEEAGTIGEFGESIIVNGRVSQTWTVVQVLKTGGRDL